MTLQYRTPVTRQFFVGFDNLFNQLDSGFFQNATDAYPPHNVIKHDEDNFTIELALAGFKESDFDIQVKDGLLSIVGMREDTRAYAHKGISSRSFEKNLRLAEYVEVIDSTFENGILSVKLRRILPEGKKARKILVNSKASLLKS